MQITDDLNKRVTVLEVQLSYIKDSLEESNKKLDDLLDLRNQGIGAFWLGSALAGTGIIGAIIAMIDWVKGIHSG